MGRPTEVESESPGLTPVLEPLATRVGLPLLDSRRQTSHPPRRRPGLCPLGSVREWRGRAGCPEGRVAVRPDVGSEDQEGEAAPRLDVSLRLKSGVAPVAETPATHAPTGRVGRVRVVRAQEGTRATPTLGPADTV